MATGIGLSDHRRHTGHASTRLKQAQLCKKLFVAATILRGKAKKYDATVVRELLLANIGEVNVLNFRSAAQVIDHCTRCIGVRLHPKWVSLQTASQQPGAMWINDCTGIKSFVAQGGHDVIVVGQDYTTHNVTVTREIFGGAVQRNIGTEFKGLLIEWGRSSVVYQFY